MNYLLVDGNSPGYYHQQSDKLHNGEMEVQAVFGFVKTFVAMRPFFTHAP